MNTYVRDSHSTRDHIPSLAKRSPCSASIVLRVFERPRIQLVWDPIAAGGDAIPFDNGQDAVEHIVGIFRLRLADLFFDLSRVLALRHGRHPGNTDRITADLIIPQIISVITFAAETVCSVSKLPK